ncbi:HAD-IIIA family hydrolase [Candidatus Methylospira mobilis]|uniref:3-deoxy-D-manno-octulosonate 8-phosphate phosphatase KdsC n=1 Tax=Candidatus Methylospira mobilis TaxID=1808979 RepID=A0A5Q0BJK2_9GAMM|nr:HAD-IIIA family hydrolase [Candidatus Methylospira mobilis]QFY43312.1 HAD-IIIA family hydrolase [Candidatus Methylospira mobilis]WNV03479.1 HAD-IIIA family hydrolase [Candidatus Methylospira mobilis]
MVEIYKRAAAIKLVIFDVDGVLTDGRLFFDEQGREYKSFHARDGLGIKLLQQTGVKVAIISGRKAPSVSARMQGLGIAPELIFLGEDNKLEAFEKLMAALKLTDMQIAHVGDDLLDLPLLRRVGLAITVADAHRSVIPHTHWQTRNPGGCGAAREVCDLIMDAQGTLDQIIHRHS